MAAAQRVLPWLRCWVALFTIVALCPADATSKDDGKGEKGAENKGKKKEHAMEGPKRWGDPDFWVKIKGMGFSEGNLKPNFQEDIENYQLTIRNGKAAQLLVTVQLDTDKYNLQELPELWWMGKLMKYSPIETIEFTMPLNETFGPLNQEVTLTCRDHDHGQLWAPTARKTYRIQVEQYPDIERIVTAQHIKVYDNTEGSPNMGKEIDADPPYTKKSKDNEIIYYVHHTVEKVKLDVECPNGKDFVTTKKYNGQISTGEYLSHRIDGASTSILAQCIYKDHHYTKGKEMQRTYVIKILRNHILQGTNVSIRIWPPNNGRCEAAEVDPDIREKNTHHLKKKFNISKKVEKEQRDHVEAGTRAFNCMGYTSSVPLLGTYTNPKAELVVVDKKTKARYRLWNGIPSHIPLQGPPYPQYELHLEAGIHKRIYEFNLTHPPHCADKDDKGVPLVNCEHAPLSALDKYGGHEKVGPLWRWSTYAKRNNYCLWKPCNVTRDFDTCCAKKGALCTSFEKCQDPKFRGNHPRTCPTLPGREGMTLENGQTYDYKPEVWHCNGKQQTISPSLRCKWTPCLPSDNAQQQCCAHEGTASCSTLDCPKDMVQRATAAMCQDIPCSKADIPNCCEYRDICTSMKCPTGYSLKYNAALFLCDGAECDIDDREQCCDSAAYCDTWTCPPLWTPKNHNALIPCGGYPCMEWDTGLCCNMKGMCSTLNCPVGYYLKPHAETRPCAGIANRTCNLQVDLLTCCVQAATCMGSYVCNKDNGFELKLEAKMLSCPGPTCTKKDRGLCCDMVDPFKAATHTEVIPRQGEGSCHQKDHDGEIGFDCEATGSGMHLMVNLTFDQPVGNQVYFGAHRITGKTASYQLPPIKELKPEGQRFEMHAHAAGRGHATSKISIYVEGSSSPQGGVQASGSVLRKLSEPIVLQPLATVVV